MKRSFFWKNLLLAAALCLMLPMTVQAASKTITVDPGKNGKDAGPAIREALYEAADKATKSTPYVIKVKPGKYKLTCELPIYSYTTLDLTGVTLTRTNKDYNMLRVGDQYDIRGKEGDTGYYYTNIKLVGGIWDGAGQYATLLKFAHAKNVTLEGVTVRHSSDGHLIEVAATDGFKCKNCTFKDMAVPKGEKTICYEAVQLDVLVPGHFMGYRAEALPVKNVVIDSCTFTDVPRGVGAHTSFFNAPHTNITVKNCTFKNNTSCAMQFQYCSKITLTGNKITGSPRGIAIYGIMPQGGTGIFKASVPAKVNGLKKTLSETYKEGLLTGYTIKKNTITLTGRKDSLAGYDALGIIVSGGTVTKDAVKSDGSGGIPKGDYYVTNATVADNTITDKTGKSYGIRFFNVRNSKITGNTITGKRNKTVNIYAINVKNNSKAVTIDRNTITNSDGNSIYLQDCGASSISGNTITNSGKYGISLERASAKSIDKNKISNTGHNGINLLNKSSADTIRSNTITNSAKYGIGVMQSSTAGTVTGNTITKYKGARAIACDSSSKIKKQQ